MNSQISTETLLGQKHFELLSDEEPIIEGLSAYLKSVFNVTTCHAALTNFRLVICKKNLVGGMVLFGVVGAAASLTRKQTKIMFQLPIAEISRVKKIKNDNFRFETRSGEKYNLAFTKPERWEAELKALGLVFE